MYKQLTVEHCLYVINKELLTQFFHCSEHQQLEGYVSMASSLDPLNNHAIVLQIWCMLNEDELNLFINPEKMMPYSIDCYMLKLLRADKKIQRLTKFYTMNQSAKFMLAYYLACATLKWGDMIILAHDNGQSLFDINQSRDYFTLAATENLVHVEDYNFYHFQKTIIHAMVMDYSSMPHWDAFIKEAVKVAQRDFSMRIEMGNRRN